MRLNCLIVCVGLTGCFSPSSLDDDGALTGTLDTGATDEAGSEGDDGTAGEGSTGAGDLGTGDETVGADETAGLDETTAGLDETGDEGSTTTGLDVTKRVFVSSRTYNGGEVATAAAECQALAVDAELGGNWVAWVSDSQTDAIDRLTPDAGPYVLVDDAATVIAVDNADLADGELLAPISITETGAPFSSNTAVWTGTGVTGTADVNTCLDWTVGTNAQNGARGNVTAVNGGWTRGSNVVCNAIARIYCFEV